MCLNKDYTRQNLWPQGAFILIEESRNVKGVNQKCDDSCERSMYRFSGKGDKGGLYQEKEIPVLSPEGGVGVCQVV